MTHNVDVAALAKLARLEVSPQELTRLQEEIPAILSFVETIQKASSEAPSEMPMLRNVMRKDENPHESGLYTDDLLAAAPLQKDNQIAVKQVISK